MIRTFDALLMLRLTGAGIGFAQVLILSRLLGPAGYGAYAFALGWVNIAFVLTTFGFHHFLVRTTPRMLLDHRYGDLRGLALSAFAICSMLALTLTLATPSLVDGLEPTTDQNMKAALLAASLLLLPMTLLFVRSGLLRGLGSPIRGQLPELLFLPFSQLIIFISLLRTDYALAADQALMITSALATAALLLSIPSTFSVLRSLPRTGIKLKLWEWIANAGKNSFLTATGIIMATTDVVMLGALSTANETGQYGIASRFFLLMQLPALALSATLSHDVPRLHATGDLESLARVVRQTGARSARFTLALGLLSTLPGLWPEIIFGQDYANASPVILILVWTRVVESIFGHPISVLSNAGAVGRTGLIVSFAAIANAFLNLLLIPHFGAVGAAISTSISNLLLTVSVAWMTWRMLGVKCLSTTGDTQKLRG